MQYDRCFWQGRQTCLTSNWGETSFASLCCILKAGTHFFKLAEGIIFSLFYPEQFWCFNRYFACRLQQIIRNIKGKKSEIQNSLFLDIWFKTGATPSTDKNNLIITQWCYCSVHLWDMANTFPHTWRLSSLAATLIWSF